MFMVDYSFWGPLVIIGILAATFSSALGSLIGAPRILQALARNKLFLILHFFEKVSSSHEPRNAIILTVGIIVVSLLLGDLDALATVITLILFNYIWYVEFGCFYSTEYENNKFQANI